MTQRLLQYKGILTHSQIANGMNSATRNAKRLFHDASVMLVQECYSSAVALAILSIEESGKHHVLRELALARNKDELMAAWRDYRQHTSKNQLWLLIDSVLRGASRLEDFGHLFDPESGHPHTLDQLKQLSLYTDCLGDAHWSVPDEVIDDGLAKALVAVAEILCQSHEITTEEIELWTYYMQPVYKTTMEKMQAALIEWDREMRARGLLRNGGYTMNEFIKHGIHIRARVRPKRESTTNIPPSDSEEVD